MDPSIVLEFVTKLAFASFVVAGVAKLFDLEQFTTTLTVLPCVPYWWVGMLRFAIPAYEVIAGTLGLAGYSLVASGMLIPLSIAFAFLTFVAMRRSLRVPCNCFGADGRFLGTGTIVTNITIIVALLLGVLPFEKHPPAVRIGYFFLAPAVVLLALGLQKLIMNKKEFAFS